MSDQLIYPTSLGLPQFRWLMRVLRHAALQKCLFCNKLYRLYPDEVDHDFHGMCILLSRIIRNVADSAGGPAVI